MLSIQRMKLLNGTEFSLALAPGQTVVIGGPNGSGKSLFLKSAALLTRATWESFRFQQQDIAAWQAQQYRRHVLYVPPQPLDTSGTVANYFQWPWQLGVRAQHVPAPEYQVILESEGYWTRDFQRLSSGEKQFVQLIRALALAPSVLFLDEALGHMDQARLSRSEELLLEFQARTQAALCLISHSASQAERLQGTSVSFSASGG